MNTGKEAHTKTVEVLKGMKAHAKDQTKSLV